MSKFFENVFCPDFSMIYNPFILKNMKEAFERTVRAINEREKIVIYGSCDVDSISGVSLLFLVFKYLNADVEYYIPDNDNHCGNVESSVIQNYINFLGADLVITVGCGVESRVQFDLFKSLGMDVIVLDRKKNQEDYGSILVNPNQEDCLYRFKELSASGLVYKFTQAISIYYNMKNTSKFIDLAMIGTISSGVKLEGENVDIANEGMEHVLKTNNHGIKALLKVQNITEISIETIRSIGDVLKPTRNAIGRMDNARIAVELFTTNNGYRAEQIAKYLNNEVGKNIPFSFSFK